MLNTISFLMFENMYEWNLDVKELFKWKNVLNQKISEHLRIFSVHMFAASSQNTSYSWIKNILSTLKAEQFSRSHVLKDSD